MTDTTRTYSSWRTYRTVRLQRKYVRGRTWAPYPPGRAMGAPQPMRMAGGRHVRTHAPAAQPRHIGYAVMRRRTGRPIGEGLRAVSVRTDTPY